MTRRRRIARLLDALMSWLLAPNLEWWSTVPQERIDAGIEAWER